MLSSTRFPLRWEPGGKQGCGSSKDSSSSAWLSQGCRHVGGKPWLGHPIYFHGKRVYQVLLYSLQKAPLRNNCEALSHDTLYNRPRSSTIGQYHSAICSEKRLPSYIQSIGRICC